MRRILLLVAAVAVVLAGCGSDEVSSDQAAVVNGEAISVDEVEEQLEYQRSLAQQQALQTGQPEPDDDALSQMVLDGLIQQRIIRDGAEDEGVSVSAEDVDEQIQQIRDQAEEQGETFEDALEQAGLTEELLRDQVETGLLAQGVGESLVPGRTDAELEEDLEERPEEVVVVDARHVLTEEEAAAAEARDELEGGADWETVASEYSTDEGTREQGGELGTVRRGATVPEFEEAVFQLAQEGECADAPGDCASPVSEPVESEFGWHVIQVTSVRLPSLDELREEEDSDQAVQQERQQALNGWFEDLAASAEVEVNPRFGEWDSEQGSLIPRDTAPQEPAETPAPAPEQAEPGDEQPADEPQDGEQPDEG